jgi:alginate O-acetyltransferase complex protein AlgJ
MSFPKTPTKHDHRLFHLGKFTLILAFLITIYLPGLGMVFHPAQHRAHNEGEANRPPVTGAWHSGWEANRPLPKLTWRLSSILSFPKDFGEYFRYNFAFRRDFIHWHTKLVGSALGQSSSPMVVEGKHGWLFLGEHGTIQDYRGMLPFSEQQLQQWQQALESRRDWLAQQGIHYLFVVCPDKHTVYPEHMPDRINRVHAQTRLDQLLRHMQEHSDVDILDLRPALREFKNIRLCYQPQESHWNGVGAFVGYQQIARRLQAWYPTLRVLALSDCEFRKQENPETDLLRLQGRENIRTVIDSLRPVRGFTAKLRREVKGPPNARMRSSPSGWGRVGDPNPPRPNGGMLFYSHRAGAPIARALVVCDSFATLMMPFLAEHFGDALFVWGGGDGFLPEDVRERKPDVVIQEIVERSLCEFSLSPLEALLAPACPPLSSARPKEDSRTQQ